MVSNLRKQTNASDKIMLRPYVLLCPKESCGSKLLYLQGTKLVYKSQAENKLISYAIAHPDTLSALEYTDIPADVLGVIQTKKKLIQDKHNLPTGSLDINDDSRNSSSSQNTLLNNDPSNTTCAKNLLVDPNSSNSQSESDSISSKKILSGFYWSVSDVFNFENVGLSKPAEGNLRFLICADCECGPLGYHLPETDIHNLDSKSDSPSKDLEYLVSINRVKYQPL
ncbi:hypothetical protein BB561_005159 [Smittium simulii]|uniref:Mss4-like protein n=1 Tax=Smittium simulii TaxID=133385 RepID=A0A2T9YBX0_9FUNG|nr:hypothetical protein BB561_005159 [Smittium simulii]